MHVVDPTAVENLPVPHKTHTDDALSPTVVEYFPVSHDVQCVAVAIDAYVPAVHAIADAESRLAIKANVAIRRSRS